MMLDPLVGAVCSPPEISQMTDEMLIAQEKWLPQYRAVMPEVKRRFASEPRLGTRPTTGAARLKLRSVDEVRQERLGQKPAAADGKAEPPRKKPAPSPAARAVESRPAAITVRPARPAPRIVRR